jgi:hypothetical protein
MKTVYDLSDKELEELRETYFDQLNDLGEEDFNDPHEIPLENVIAHYEELMFVDEDFFCNLDKKS